MLTNEGKNHIRRYMAGYVPNIAQAIAYGIGSEAESASSTALQLEAGRIPIVITGYDFVTDSIIFKASFPTQLSAYITEVGLYSQFLEDGSFGSFASKNLSTFDSATEAWTTSGTESTYGTTNTRIGIDSLVQTVTASSSRTSSLSDIVFDLSGYVSLDTFKLALHNTGNTTNIKVVFKNDNSNYFTGTYTGIAAGYQILSLDKAAFVATGSPDWRNITQIDVISTAGVGGSTVILDALRVVNNSINVNSVLVSREVLSVPIVKTEGVSQDIEFALKVNIT